MKKAIFCGSFNPITVGHLDVIKRAGALADTLYVVVMFNADKHYQLTAQQRVELTQQACKNIKNVKVEAYDGALIDYCQQKKCNVVIKSVRNAEDMNYEAEMADLNKQFGGIETLYLLASPEFRHISSSLVRANLAENKPITDLVPLFVEKMLTDIYKE